MGVGRRRLTETAFLSFFSDPEGKKREEILIDKFMLDMVSH
jgi:hypothetical protein